MEKLSQKNLPAGDPEVAAVLATAHGRRWRRRVGRLGSLITVLLAAWTFVVWRTSTSGAQVMEYETRPIERGDLEMRVNATGTLNALNTVEVGAEITGKVLEINIEFNDRVEKDQVLATIDTEAYAAKVDEAGAKLVAARASLATARATVAEARQTVQRQQRLYDAGLTSAQDIEAATAAFERAKATVESNAAQVALNQASLKVAESSVRKAIIRSPIDGIVLDRSVEVGQTVTSGLQTPVLFTLAADLDVMRLEVAIDEADVGLVKVGQSTVFTVDAYPEREFESSVLAVKNVPIADSSVVTYVAWLTANNEERLLRPGMTATASILVRAEKDVLLAPNAALRFTPPTTAETEGFSLSRLMPGPPSHEKSAQSQSEDGYRTVWVLDDPRGEPQRLRVSAGGTDGTQTLVKSKDLCAGTQVVINAIEVGE